MYHRFEENKYPSTNIRIDVFKKHLNIIESNKLSFLNPRILIMSLIELVKRKKFATIDDAFHLFI